MSGDVCVTQIRPQPEYNHDGSKQVVAFHREYYRGDDESRQGELQKFWDNQINIRPPTTEFIDSALSIWQATCINVPHGATAHMMKMNRIDQSTADALQAALFSTEMATLGQVDFDAIAYALCVFVHSHPAFLDMIPGNRIPSPYGENTVYGLADLVV